MRITICATNAEAAENAATVIARMEMMKSEDQSNIRMVRPVDRSLLGQEGPHLIPLPVADDRDFDYLDPGLRDEADLVMRLSTPNP